MTAAKQTKKSPSATPRKRNGARKVGGHQSRTAVRTAGSARLKTSTAAERSSGAQKKKKSRVTAQKTLARRTPSSGVGVGDQIVHYLRTTIERLTALHLAHDVRRDALRLFDSLRSQEKEVARAVRLQVRHWQTRRAQLRKMQPVKDALQWLDVRRLPVAGHR